MRYLLLFALLSSFSMCCVAQRRTIIDPPVALPATVVDRINALYDEHLVAYVYVESDSNCSFRSYVINFPISFEKHVDSVSRVYSKGRCLEITNGLCIPLVDFDDIAELIQFREYDTDSSGSVFVNPIAVESFILRCDVGSGEVLFDNGGSVLFDK